MAAKRVLALDPGTKRIGVALSDELRWTAQPLETFERRSMEADIRHIRELVERHDVSEVLIGLPIRMDGSIGPEAASVQQLQRTLEEQLAVPVIAWDERLTSRSAEQFLIEANVSRKKRRGAVDRVAAALLLQSYLQQTAREAETDAAGRRSRDDGAAH
jgi:putative Holliday junction resolvase